MATEQRALSGGRTGYVAQSSTGWNAYIRDSAGKETDTSPSFETESQAQSWLTKHTRTSRKSNFHKKWFN